MLRILRAWFGAETTTYSLGYCKDVPVEGHIGGFAKWLVLIIRMLGCFGGNFVISVKDFKALFLNSFVTSAVVAIVGYSLVRTFDLRLFYSMRLSWG